MSVLRNDVSVKCKVKSGRTQQVSSYHRDSNWLFGHPSICHHGTSNPGIKKKKKKNFMNSFSLQCKDVCIMLTKITEHPHCR